MSDIYKRFQTLKEQSDHDLEFRKRDGVSANKLGMKFLDRALVGLLPTDLCVIGAKTGIGKTEISLHIAATNSSEGKRVGFVALEAEEKEIYRRLKYKELARIIEEKHRSSYVKKPVSYRLFRFGKMSSDYDQYDDEANQAVIDKYKKLSIYYREEAFDIETLNQIVIRAKDEVDILVIDHLHYFDTMGEDVHQEYSKIMKAIRNLNLLYSIPIILVAHLRKNNTESVPGIEDFMGTSDIGKIATVAITLAPNYDRQDYRNNKHDTYFRIVKSRLGNLSRLVASVVYDSSKNTYMQTFELFKITGKGGELERIQEQDWPLWSKEDPEEVDIPF